MKKKIHSTGIVVLLLSFITINTAASPQHSPGINNKTARNSVYNQKFTYKIIDADSSTFGYDIYLDGKLKIHQTSIPALPGNKGFKTKTQAEKVAKLVIRKMMAGEMPPTVHMEELKKLKVL